MKKYVSIIMFLISLSGFAIGQSPQVEMINVGGQVIDVKTAELFANQSPEKRFTTPIERQLNQRLDKNHPDRYEIGQMTNKNLKGGGTGSISGRVTDEVTGDGLVHGVVWVYDENHNHVIGVYTDQDGYYQIPSVLNAGSYNVFTDRFYGYNNELYGGTHCFTTCYSETSTLVVVGSGDTADINFIIDEGIVISGSVEDAQTNDAVSGAEVRIYDQSGNSVTNVYSFNAEGEYLTTGLEPGSYFVRTYNSSGYLNELYDDQLCVGWCDVTNGALVTVNNASVSGIDFILDKGAQIFGQITDSQSGLGINDISFYVDIFDQNGNYVTNARTYFDDGYYQTDGGLPPGTYYLKTNHFTDEYINEVYDNVQCNGTAWCNTLDGTPIVVSNTMPITGIDFALDKGYKISGTVSGTDTSQPIDDIRLAFYDSNYKWLGYAYTDQSGVYTSPLLAPGNYIVSTNGHENHGYVNEVYDNIPCGPTPCYFDNANLVTLSMLDVSGIDFALDPGATISGVITDDMTGEPLSIPAYLYSSTGQSFYGVYSSSVTGAYTFPAMPVGTYYVKTRNYLGYIDEVYDDMECMGNWHDCDATTGTPIVISNTNPVENIDFALNKPDDIFENGFEQP